MSQEPGLPPVRCVVTGHDDAGRSVIVRDHIGPHTLSFPGFPDYGHTDLWRTTVPADNATEGLPLEHSTMAPPAGGVVFRVTQFPPDSRLAGFDPEQTFGGLPEGAGAEHGGGSRDVTMHRTQSVDFAVVLRGRIHAILDEDEVELRAGDTLVQRGTMHGWRNRGDDYCLVAFVLVDARPDAGAT